MDVSTRNFTLTLSIENVSLLNGGQIRCDDSSAHVSAVARCPLACELTGLMLYYVEENIHALNIYNVSTSSCKK